MNIKIHNPNSVFALKDLPDDDIILARSSLAWGHGTPFRNKMFMLDEMTQQNTSKFAIFYIYENPKLPSSIFHFMLLYFFP